jgi:hypothetical protein
MVTIMCPSDEMAALAGSCASGFEISKEGTMAGFSGLILAK